MEIALYFYKPFEIGGTEKTVLERAKLLKELGHNITFIFGQASKNINMLEQWSKVGNVINQNYIDKFYDLAIYDSIYNNKLIPAKEYIQVINGNVIDAGDMLSNNIPIDKYVSVSEETQKQLKDKLGIDSVIIPNIICKNIKELAKEKYSILKKRYNFVIVSRIDPQKGLERVAEFVKRLHTKTQDYQIVVVGSNYNYPKYEEELKNRLSKYNIIWEGLQNNPYKYIKNADYLIQLSDYESQCIVMYESLILGKPVIVTDFGTAVKEITEERGFVLKKDLSDLDIDTILKKKGKFKFEYSYPDVKDKWKEIIKPFEKKDLKFSIIIPNYNNADWLDKCLMSVAEQTYKNYEVIFIDDMSTDNSIDIAYKYIEKIKEFQIIKLQQKRYNGGARNVGVLEVTGDYIVCLDSDDWLKHNKVLELLNTRIRNEDVIFTGFDLYNGKTEGLFPYIPKMKNLYEAFTEDVCACWTKVIKTSIFKDTLFPEGTLAEDRVWHYRIIDKCNKFSLIQESTHVWNRANTHSTTTDRGIEWEASCIKHLGEMYKFIKTTKNEDYKKYVQQKYTKHKEQLDRNVYQQL